MHPTYRRAAAYILALTLTHLPVQAEQCTAHVKGPGGQVHDVDITDVPSCGRSWRRAYRDLSCDEKLYLWRQQPRQTRLIDITGDGTPEEVSWESDAPGGCPDGSAKRNLVVYGPPEGQKIMVNWQGPLITGIGVEEGRLIVNGFDERGERWRGSIDTETGRLEDMIGKARGERPVHGAAEGTIRADTRYDRQ